MANIKKVRHDVLGAWEPQSPMVFYTEALVMEVVNIIEEMQMGFLPLRTGPTSQSPSCRPKVTRHRTPFIRHDAATDREKATPLVATERKRRGSDAHRTHDGM